MSTTVWKKIGMTEAGDAGRDFTWFNTLTQVPAFKGAILITKYGQNEEFQEKAKALFKIKPCIIHFGCTGWGNSKMEPGNVTPEEYINSIRSFIDSGFPAENIVLRIDPIFPNKEGIDRALNVIRLAQSIIPDVKRIRISIYDDYHNSREEIVRRGYEPIDNITKWKNEQERRPTDTQVKMVADALIKATPNQIFECCAEPEIAKAYSDHFVWTGCLSKTDCDIMGIEIPNNVGINGQNRFGCRCLTMKQELLSKKHRCQNNCAYCYWGRN